MTTTAAIPAATTGNLRAAHAMHGSVLTAQNSITWTVPLTETTADYRLRLILDATVEAIESGKDMRDAIWRALVTTDEHARLSTLATVEAGERGSLPMTKKQMERVLWSVSSRHLPTPAKESKQWIAKKPNWYQMEEK